MRYWAPPRTPTIGGGWNATETALWGQWSVCFSSTVVLCRKWTATRFVYRSQFYWQCSLAPGWQAFLSYFRVGTLRILTISLPRTGESGRMSPCKNAPVSLPRGINLKFPLQPQQKYHITRYGELGFPWLTQMKDYYTTNSHYLTYTLLFRKAGRTYFLELGSERVKRARPVLSFAPNLKSFVARQPPWDVERSCVATRARGFIDVFTPKSDQFQISPAASPEI